MKIKVLPRMLKHQELECELSCSVFGSIAAWCPIDQCPVFGDKAGWHENKVEIPEGHQWLWRYCSPDLEFITVKCRPYYLPREFASIIVSNDVYIPPQVDTNKALIRLHETLGRHRSDDLDAALTDDFNKACFQTAMPNLYQHITCHTRGERILDHYYVLFKD